MLSWILTGDPGVMICLTAGLAALERKDATADGRLLEIENEIFELKEKIEAFNPEMARLQNIWSDEMCRLYEARRTGECTLSKEEVSAAVAAMPEAIEHRADELTSQMWSTPARTPEERRAKLMVLLAACRT